MNCAVDLQVYRPIPQHTHKVWLLYGSKFNTPHVLHTHGTVRGLCTPETKNTKTTLMPDNNKRN